MSPWLAAGAVLAFGVGLAHSVLGERYILMRLMRRDLPKLFGKDTFTKRTLRFAWHLTTIAWWGFAAQMAWAAGALGRDRPRTRTPPSSSPSPGPSSSPRSSPPPPAAAAT